MAQGNDAVCSRSLTDVTTATRRPRLISSIETLISPSSLHAPLPTLPFDLIPEILCRLPVKLLLQFKCVCKSWKSLISDPKFAKKHLHMSTTCRHHHHLIVSSRNTSRKWLLWDSPISYIFSKVSSSSNVPQLELVYPDYRYGYGPYGNGCVVSSCDGILLFDFDLRSPLLWNPSIRKFKILPPLLKPSRGRLIYTFGYDHFIDNYKIFAVSAYPIYESEVDVNQWKTEVTIYTLGYDFWRRIDDFPCDGPIYEAGIFVSGTVNWLAFDASGSSLSVLVSLDLEKELYRKLLTPDFNMSQWTLGNKNQWTKNQWTLGVLMDCLCIFTNSDEFLDVWVMKEYGIKESWTKLFSVPYEGGSTSSFYYTKVVYVSEDDLVLLDRKEWKLVVYNSRNGTFKIRNGTFKITKIQNISSWMVHKVYVDSLISPCS